MKPPRVAPFPSETALSTACQKRVRKEWLGEVLKVHGNASQMAGTPDLLCCVAGRFCAVELKQPGKDATPLQKKRLRDWQAAGALVGVVHTEVELDELLAHAADLSWRNPDFMPLAS